MLSLLRRKISSSKTTTITQSTDDVDLSSWELVNLSDEDDVITPAPTFPIHDVIAPEPTFQVSDVIAPEKLEEVEVTRQQETFGDDDVDENDDDDVYGDDVDDDLVPWEFKGRFGKQRMGKVMGKKCVPKSKHKLPCYYHQKPKSFYEKTQILVR